MTERHLGLIKKEAETHILGVCLCMCELCVVYINVCVQHDTTACVLCLLCMLLKGSCELAL